MTEVKRLREENKKLQGENETLRQKLAKKRSKLTQSREEIEELVERKVEEALRNEARYSRVTVNVRGTIFSPASSPRHE